MQRILDAGFLFFHFGFGRGTDIDHRNAAGEFSQAFLQFLFIIIRIGVLDLLPDLGDAAVDRLRSLPAPSMIVVFSLSTFTLLARPDPQDQYSQALIPRSSVIAFPPVRIAISSSMACAVAVPGALTAQH